MTSCIVRVAQLFLGGCAAFFWVLPAQAHWELAAQANQGFYYLDPDSIKTEGERKTVWTVLDYRQDQALRDGARYRSMHAQVQLNCKARLARLVHLTYYSEGMLKGRQVMQQGMLQDWFEVEAGSPMHRIAYRVC